MGEVNLLAELKLKIGDLYGDLVKAQINELNNIGAIVILDVEKMANRIWEIKLLADKITKK